MTITDLMPWVIAIFWAVCLGVVCLMAIIALMIEARAKQAKDVEQLSRAEARVERLREALQCVRERTLEDNSRCYCLCYEEDEYHEPECAKARAALVETEPK